MSQQGHPNKMLVDSRMRDIRRRIEVIQKKLADLQEMGVPCAFCYSSVRNTGSIFTLGDKRITNVIEQHRNEILCNLMEGGSNDEADTSMGLHEIHLILPVLPAPLDDLGRATLQSMIVGILKDLGIRWSDPKPVWWPEDIPFVPPRSAPESFAGNWIQALKRILKSVYSYFCYDTASYIAGKLESQTKNGSTSWGDVITGKTSGSSSRLGAEETDDEREESERMEESSEMDDDDDNEDDCEEGDAFIEISADHQAVMTSSERHLTGRVVHIPQGYADRADPVVSKSPAKLISSFTVENILMGRQHSSCSSSSNSSSLSSPGNTMRSASIVATPPVHAPVYSPTNTSPPSAVTTNIVHTSSLPCASSTSSSIVGVNWVSHPPVKYTKFTMLSPTAMSDEAQKKKKVNYEPSSILIAKSSRSGGETHEASITATESIAKSFALSTTSSQPTIITPLNSILTTRESATTAATSSTSSAIQVYPITSLKELPPSADGVSTATTTKLCPLPVVTTIPPASASPPVNSLDRKSTTTQGFSQPQQYVFIVPSNSVTMALPQTSQHQTNQHQLLEDLSQAKRTASNSVIIGNSSNHSGSLLTSQSPHNTSTSIFSKKPGSAFTSEKISKNLNTTPEINSNNFRLIAPKQSIHSASPSSERGAKLKGIKRGSQKPHKLRFHMTTVVTKQKREPLKSSLTVESPSAIVSSDMAGSSSSASPTSSADDAQDKNIAIESTITLSPNVYSIDAKSSKPPEGSGIKNIKHKEAHADINKADVTDNDVLREHEGREAQKEKKVLSSELTSEPKMKVRATRNYTRRKRELTFHLYEEPGATFRIKKACKE